MPAGGDSGSGVDGRLGGGQLLGLGPEHAQQHVGAEHEAWNRLARQCALGRQAAQVSQDSRGLVVGEASKGL